MQTKNANYTVRQLPAPPRLRTPTAGPYRTFLRSTSSTSYAVAVTHEHTIIWDYTTATAAQNPRTLNLPETITQSEPLPLANLVTSGSSNELGLILVHPASGKIAFWENVDDLEPVTLFKQRRAGVDGYVQGMARGDLVEEVVEAQHAGYILRFRSGQLAHLMVRDAQGRPTVAVRLLESNNQRGWFSGWLSTWRDRLVAIETRALAVKGNVEIVASTKDGIFKTWEVSWTGQSSFTAVIDASQEIRNTLIQENVLDPISKEEVKVLDFVLQKELHPNSNEVIVANGNSEGTGFNAVALALIESTDVLKYALLQLTVTRNSTSLNRIIPVTVFEPAASSITSTPKLLLPLPEHTAYLVFDHAIVIISMAHHEDSPDDQLLAESGSVRAGFQDVIHLRNGKATTIVASAPEVPLHPAPKVSSVSICTQSEGLLRIISTPFEVGSRKADRGKVNVRNKLEQAIVYGSELNPIDFSVTSGFAFTPKEVEDAAVRVSQDIIRSTIEGFPETTASMEQHLLLRARYLRDLASHLKANYRPLSRVVRWMLLWDAEKVAAARSLWYHYEKRLDGLQLLKQVVEWINEKDGLTKTREAEAADQVRLWFTKDIGRLEKFFPALLEVVVIFYQKDITKFAETIQWIIEADEFICGSLEAAFDLRADNLHLYGLDNEKLDNGILTSGYEGLPEIWTSRPQVMNALRQSAAAFFELAVEESKYQSKQNGHRAPTQEQREKVAQQQPDLVLLACKAHI